MFIHTLKLIVWKLRYFGGQRWHYLCFNEGQKSNFVLFFFFLKKREKEISQSDLKGIIIPIGYSKKHHMHLHYSSFSLHSHFFSFLFLFFCFLTEPPYQPPFAALSSQSPTRIGPRESPATSDATLRSLDENNRRRSHKESSKFTSPSRIFAFFGTVRIFFFWEMRPDLECTLNDL